MEYEKPFTNCKQAIKIYREEISTLRQQRPNSPPTFLIDFVFSCRPSIRNYVFNPQQYPYPQFEENLDLPEITSLAYFSLDKFLLQEPAREIIQQRLENWPVSKNWRTSFIDYVMLKAQDKIINMPRRDNTVCLKFEVITIHEHVFDKRAAEESIRINQNYAEESIRIDQDHAEESIRIDQDHAEESIRIDPNHAEESIRIDQNRAEESIRIDQDRAEEYTRINMFEDGDDDDHYSTTDEDDDYDDDFMNDEDWMEQDDDYMIPTLESAIESLETKMVIDDTTCTICLEKLSREGVSIGCSHIFHGDCIKTWLRNSHYCPVCRFEMPTAS